MSRASSRRPTPKCHAFRCSSRSSTSPRKRTSTAMFTGSTGRPVSPGLPSRLPASAGLTLFGLTLSIVIAVPLGILAAVKQGSWIDHLCRIVATAGVSLPVFFPGLLLVYLFYFRLGWSPAPIGRLDAFAAAPEDITGFCLVDSLLTGDFETLRASFSQLLLPAFTLGIFSLAPIARLTRASILA